MTLSDENIILLLRAGNEAAFEMIFKSLYSRLYAFSKEYVIDSSVAENIIQDTFMVLWKKKGDLKEDTNLKAYLYTIVKNSCLKYLRRQSYSDAFQQYALKEKAELALNEIALSHLNTSELAVKEIEQIIADTLNSLPPRCREVFEMSRFSGLKNREIANQLQISEKAVEANISRALKVLRVSLKDYLPLFTALYYGVLLN